VSATARLRLEIHGAVQGVGFRPFVYRVARELDLGGWVLNGTAGVVVEVEGDRPRLEQMRHRLAAERPAPAVVQSVAERWLAPLGEFEFHIVESEGADAKSAVVLPDLAVCPDCVRELFDPADRRYRYPFVNCTHCGPRFSIVFDLPYDRPRTTMRGFAMCAECREEYENPLDRRFHAQPVACPRCGPQLAAAAADGAPLALGEAALGAAVAALERGAIVALKGIGGYQLLVDARDDDAVGRLRDRKRRPTKPLAVLAADVDAVRRVASLEPAEAALLTSPEAPIVLLRRHADSGLAAAIAPGNPNVGLLLPTSPLHHLLVRDAGFPLVATSGNLSDEPIAIDDGEALERLGGIADLFLTHDRPIVRHVDDGVAWISGGAPQVLRRARGVAPLPFVVAADGPTVVATGGHQKVVAALALQRQVFLSQHIGDMESPEARHAFERVLLDFLRIYEARPEAIAHDLHPDYPTTAWASAAATASGGLLARCGFEPGTLPLVAVQHHHAHLASTLAEHARDEATLALTWDGTGYGADGTIWGGEALFGDAGSFVRRARFRPFALPGGEAAIRDPRRVALALLWELEGEAAADRGLSAFDGWSAAERSGVAHLLRRDLRSPRCSSVGRLFDGVAALLGLAGRISFEGEAAMRLEACAATEAAAALPFELGVVTAPAGLAPGELAEPSLLEVDWRPAIAELLAEQARGTSASRLAARFHATLADLAAVLARRFDAGMVALTGGCFQNRRLTAEVAARLAAEGRTALVQRAVPPNDGGLALGQVAVARARLHRD